MSVRDAVWRSRAMNRNHTAKDAANASDEGQQRLHAAEQRVAPAGGQQAVATRVEAALQGP